MELDSDDELFKQAQMVQMKGTFDHESDTSECEEVEEMMMHGVCVTVSCFASVVFSLCLSKQTVCVCLFWLFFVVRFGCSWQIFNPFPARVYAVFCIPVCREEF